MANGMGSLFIGVTGLQSAQTALNTTAHNLSNINTEGYTRQQITFSDTMYMDINTRATTTIGKGGLGVTVEEIRRIRDKFIDEAYRSENSRLGFYQSMANAVEEVEDQFGEMQGVTYEQTLINLQDAVSELHKNPNSTVARASLIQYASAFVDKSQAIYKGLKDYQNTLNTEVENYVKEINDLGATIHDLNKRIAAIEAAGVEDANDLRDQRDKALDTLSKYVDITYYEADNTEVIVSAETAPFVTMTGVTEIQLRKELGSELLIPTWEAYKRDVYQSYNYSNARDTDKGALKGLLIARGMVEVDYRDVPVVPDSADYDLTTPDGQAEYNKAYDEYKEKQNYYNTNIELSPILSAMVGVDKLVNGIVESLNDVLCPEVTVDQSTEMMDDSGNPIQADLYTYNAVSDSVMYNRYGDEVSGTDNGDGTYSYLSEEKLYTDATATTPAACDKYTYSMLDMEKTDYGNDEDKSVGIELFSRYNTPRYIVKTAADGTKTYIRNNLNANARESLYALGNLQVNPEAAQNVGKLPISPKGGGEDFEKALELLDVWDKKFASLNPEQYAKSDFMSFYNNFVGDFATSGNILNNFVINRQTMVDSYDNQRLQTEGVSSDEELEKMIKYQQAYNASSRYISTVSEMLEHLITSLGA